MNIGAFTDKNRRPKDADVVQALGSAHQRWSSLIEYLRADFKPREDFAFLYGKRYGWALRFRFKGRLLMSIFPNNGYFTVQVILGTTKLADVDRVRLHKNALAALSTANLYAEGRSLFVPVCSDTDLKDVMRLLRLKTAQTGTPNKLGGLASR